MKASLQVVVLLALIGCIYGYSYHVGECPLPEPMQGFDMEKFLGIWHVIQKSTTFARCMLYNYTHAEHPNEYYLTLSSPNVFSWFTKTKHRLSYQGKLTLPHPELPSKMIVKFPLSVAGLANYTIIDTDYDNYAVVFTCQKLAFAHRRAATILSRKSTIDKGQLHKLRSLLHDMGIGSQLSKISQEHCPDPEDYPKIHIDNDIISSQNVATLAKNVGGAAVEKLGETIGEAIQDKIGSTFDKAFIKEKRNSYN